MQYKVKQTFKIKCRTSSTEFEVNQVVDEKNIYGVLQELGLIEEIEEECKHENIHSECANCGEKPKQEQIKPSQWINQRMKELVEYTYKQSDIRSQDDVDNVRQWAEDKALLDFLDEHFSK